MTPWLRALWQQTWQRAVWHTVCIIGGALTIANNVPAPWQRLAVGVITLIVVLPHLCEAWQEIRRQWTQQSLPRARHGDEEQR